jgi:hypothetical protein
VVPISVLGALSPAGAGLLPEIVAMASEVDIDFVGAMGVGCVMMDVRR